MLPSVKACHMGIQYAFNNNWTIHVIRDIFTERRVLDINMKKSILTSWVSGGEGERGVGTKSDGREIMQVK